MQEIGRAARGSGEKGSAFLYFNISDIAPNVQGMTDDMRTFCRIM